MCATKYPVDGEHVTGRQDSQLVPLLVQCRIFAGSDNILGRFEPFSSIELNYIISLSIFTVIGENVKIMKHFAFTVILWLHPEEGGPNVALQ